MSHLRLATLMLNEAKTLPKLAESCRGLIDSAFIMDDDGSTDHSDEIALHLFGEFCDVEVQRGSFKTKSEKWNAVLDGARKMGGRTDYLLITNSDEPPELLQPLPELINPLYKLNVRHNQTEFLGAYIVRADFPCEFQGRVHETLVPLVDVPGMFLPHIVIHRGDSLATDEDRETQLRMLREDFAEDPSARTQFYIGMTLATLGRKGEAFEAFMRRAGMIGYGDETFYALYMAGFMAQDFDVDTAIAVFKRAIAYNSQRPEPYYSLAFVFNLLGKPKEAKKWAQQGLRLPKSQFFLFANKWIVETGMQLEYDKAVAALPS